MLIIDENWLMTTYLTFTSIRPNGMLFYVTKLTSPGAICEFLPENGYGIKMTIKYMQCKFLAVQLNMNHAWETFNI